MNSTSARMRGRMVQRVRESVLPAKYFLGGNKLTDAGLQALRQIPSLTHLDLGGRQGTDANVWAIRMSDVGLDAILSLKARSVWGSRGQVRRRLGRSTFCGWRAGIKPVSQWEGTGTPLKAARSRAFLPTIAKKCILAYTSEASG
jgi:hypothetical protein